MSDILCQLNDHEVNCDYQEQKEDETFYNKRLSRLINQIIEAMEKHK